MARHEFTNRLILKMREIETGKHGTIDSVEMLWNVVSKEFLSLWKSSPAIGSKITIDELEKAFLPFMDIVSDYSSGNVAGSLSKMKDMLFNAGSYNFNVFEWGDENQYSYSYRMRGCDKYEQLSKEELFHIPFNLLKKVGTQRYSMIGFPCLYLGNSLYNCWEEIKRPDLAKVNFSCYRHKKKLRLLNIVFPADYNTVENCMQAVITMMCSKNVPDDNAVFKYEYVFPQLILQAIIENGRYDGIRYLSTKQISGKSLYPKENDDAIMLNYVIPVQKVVTGKKYCPHLASIFESTEPKAQFVDALKPTVRTSPKGATEYERSPFGNLEYELQKGPFKTINTGL